MEPRGFEQRLESLGVTKAKDGGHQPCSLGTDVSLQPSTQGIMPWTALDGAPYRGGEATASNEHAVGLSESFADVWKELQALLTHHDIELAARKRQSHCIAFTPFHGWFPGTGERQHIAVEIEPDD